MEGCIYRTKDGECDLYSEGGKFKAFCVGNEPCEGRKISNVDRIRAMDIDHLIEWYCRGRPCERCPYNDVECRIRGWLQQEAEP